MTCPSAEADRRSGPESSVETRRYAVAIVGTNLVGRPRVGSNELDPGVERFERARRDADDLVGLAVESDRAAEHAWVFLIVRLPVRLRQHDELVGVDDVRVGRKEGANQRLDPDDVEHVGRGTRAHDARGTAVLAERAFAELPEAEARECVRVLLEVEVLRDVARRVVQPRLGEGVVNLDDALGLGKRERFDHERVEHREDRRVRADTQRERHERGRGKSFVLREHAHREA